MDRLNGAPIARGILFLVVLTALLVVVGLMSTTSVAYAEMGCESCHVAGGFASDPAFHPVPPRQTWDRWSGQCFICHEWNSDYDPTFQNAPYGPYAVDDHGGGPNQEHYYIRNSNCDDCHGGEVQHGRNILSPMTGTINLVGTDCSGCHTSGMSIGETKYGPEAVPQIDPATHGDPGDAHAAAVSPECADCHSSDIVGIHPSCGTCHGAMPIAGETCISCHPAYTSNHGWPIYGGQYNPGYNGGTPFVGYLSWEWAVEQDPENNVGGPHGNYTTSTNKCAVCHAVHRADGDGVALTAWGGIGNTPGALTGTEPGVLAPFESCFFCHGNSATFTDKTVEFAVTAEGTLSPHTTCGRCHTASPHGAGTSAYPVLASKLINTKADPTLAYDLENQNNGLTAAMFDLSDPTLVDQGLTLATGYLCVGCHGSATNEHVFAVNTYGATPALHYTSNGTDVAGNVTGHRVWAEATETWNADGSMNVWYSGGGPHDYYTAEYIAGPGIIAYNDALGCGACHDALRANGKLAFPHGYVDADGAPAPKGADSGASFLWMTIAENSGAQKILMLDTAAGQGVDGTKDGACLKCHLNADESAGVGVTY